MKQMRQSRQEEKNNFYKFLFSFLILMLSFSQAYSQTISVSGAVTVTSSNVTVQNAMVTFIDDSDTTKQYTAITDSTGKYQIDNITAIESEQSNLPSTFQLEQNYPNPFSSSTEIPYKLNKQSDVHVTIYDILGREVRKFSYSTQGAGSHSVLWNGRNNFGERVAAGIYFYRLEAAGQSLVKKMVFGAGQNNISIPTPYVSPQTSSLNKTTDVFGGRFTVRIANTDSTFPMISSQTNNNETVQNNATIDFSVSTLYPIANSNVYMDSTQQIIRGFGAANIVTWRPDMTDPEIQTAFGTGNGQLGFSLLRLRIPPDSTQWNIDTATARKAYDMGVKIFATPWTPPAAMKSNNSTTGGELLTSSYAAFAAYLNSFSNYMARNGVPLYAISIQNEPDISVGYESCSWNASQFLDFCKNYAQVINTKVIMPESYHFNHSLSDPTLNDSVAASHISIIGGHIYGGGIAPYPLATSKGKDLWMTEYLINSGGPPTNLSIDTGWTGAIQLAQSMSNCMNANMSAYVYWYIVRYYGPIADGTYATAGTVTKKGYVMSQFARFIRPGFYKIQSTFSPQGNVYATTYKDNTSKVVIVAINTNTSPVYQTFTMNGGSMTNVTPYTTSASKDCEQGNAIKVTNGSFTAELEPSSITTFVSN